MSIHTVSEKQLFSKFMHEHPAYNEENQDPDWKKAVIVWNDNHTKENENEIFYKLCSVVWLVDWCWLRNFIAWGASCVLLSHLENYHKPWHHNITNNITMPGCRCTNKKSCLIKKSSTSKWKCFTCTPTKQRINFSNPNS